MPPARIHRWLAVRCRISRSSTKRRRVQSVELRFLICRQREALSSRLDGQMPIFRRPESISRDHSTLAVGLRAIQASARIADLVAIRFSVGVFSEKGSRIHPLKLKAKMKHPISRALRVSMPRMVTTKVLRASMGPSPKKLCAILKGQQA